MTTPPAPSSTPSTSEAGLPGGESEKLTLEGDSGMKPLSDELNELSVRAKKTGDVIGAAVARDREWLRARLDTVKSAMDDQGPRADGGGASGCRDDVG
jgi:hypothetical protein